jgi:preprotein translocase subunit SecA
MLTLILKSILGDKNQTDIRKIKPIIDKIKQFEPSFQQLSNDELRAKTPYFQKLIQESVQGERDQKKNIQETIRQSTDLLVKRGFFEQIEGLIDNVYKQALLINRVSQHKSKTDYKVNKKYLILI